MIYKCSDSQGRELYKNMCAQPRPSPGRFWFHFLWDFENLCANGSRSSLEDIARGAGDAAEPLESLPGVCKPWVGSPQRKKKKVRRRTGIDLSVRAVKHKHESCPHLLEAEGGRNDTQLARSKGAGKPEFEQDLKERVITQQDEPGRGERHVHAPHPEPKAGVLDPVAGASSHASVVTRTF